MADRWLWKWLIIPVGVVAGLLLAVHRVTPMDGFWLNLSASLLATLITVLYVDRILERHRRLRWGRPLELIADRILLTTSSNITNLRRALGFPPPEGLSITPSAMHLEYLRYCALVMEPRIRLGVRQLDVDGWRKLARGIQASYTNCENALSLFGAKLDPQQLQLMIEIENGLRGALLPYETFPDLLGVPDDQLPQTKSDSRHLRDHHADWAGQELEAAVRACRELGEYQLGKSKAAGS